MDNELTITAKTLHELLDNVDAATPPGKVAVCGEMEKDKGWSVKVRFKDE